VASNSRSACHGACAGVRGRLIGTRLGTHSAVAFGPRSVGPPTEAEHRVEEHAGGDDARDGGAGDEEGGLVHLGVPR